MHCWGLGVEAINPTRKRGSMGKGQECFYNTTVIRTPTSSQPDRLARIPKANPLYMKILLEGYPSHRNAKIHKLNLMIEIKVCTYCRLCDKREGESYCRGSKKYRVLILHGTSTQRMEVLNTDRIRSRYITTAGGKAKIQH